MGLLGIVPVRGDTNRGEAPGIPYLVSGILYQPPPLVRQSDGLNGNFSGPWRQEPGPGRHVKILNTQYSMINVQLRSGLWFLVYSISFLSFACISFAGFAVRFYLQYSGLWDKPGWKTPDQHGLFFLNFVVWPAIFTRKKYPDNTKHSEQDIWDQGTKGNAWLWPCCTLWSRNKSDEPGCKKKCKPLPERLYV